MAPEETWKQDLVERARAGKVVLVCGAGLSVAISGNTQTATWPGLIDSGLDYLGGLRPEWGNAVGSLRGLIEADPSVDSYITAAEWINRVFKGQARGEFLDWIRRTIGSLRPIDRGFESVLRQPVPVLTTNYDQLLEGVSSRLGMTWTEIDQRDRFHENPADYVFHLHGRHELPDSIVLSGSDYQRLSSDQTTTEVLQAFAASHTFMFLGYGAGLADPNFTGFLQWYEQRYGGTGRRAYVLVRAVDLPVDRLQGKLAYLPYGATYKDLPGFLDELFGASPALATPPVVAVVPEPVDSSLDPLRLLPASVQRKAADQIGMASAREDVQKRMLSAAVGATDSRQAALISAVTGTGKTTVARLAMNYAVGTGHSTVMIFPTKALVAQESREWESWVEAWRGDRKIRVYPSSRDYPENDSPVSKGRFEVAIAIYEKLLGYLISGQRTLGKTSLLVVDEMQTLVEDQKRAAKLESLLTMVRLMPQEERPGILGLSATMSAQSTEVLRSWLGVDTFSFVQSSKRPVPLDTYVMDSNRWRLQRDAHLMSLSERDAQLPEPVTEEHDLADITRNSTRDRIQVRGLSTGPLAVSLVTRLLNEDRKTRILVFVPGRTAAQELALAIQKSLDATMGAVARRRGSPWQIGRFADPDVDADAAERRFLALQDTDLPLASEVVRGLRTGVAYHSARLSPRLRRDLEDDFRDRCGVLRVLVATDTLAIGVNLPADVVIATSISGYGSDRLRRLSMPAELDNKAGRAGRRGVANKERGAFYILVPSERDLQGVAGLTADSVLSLSSMDGVFERYVVGHERTDRVTGRIRELDDIALLSLHVLCSDGFGRRMPQLATRVGSVLKALLAAQEPDVQLPADAEVIERLSVLGLLDRDADDKHRPTRLGEALAKSGLALGSAHVLELLSRLATQGTGDIDLLFHACRSDEIEGVTAWVGLPGVHPRHYPSLKENIQTYALAYLHEEEVRRKYCAQYFGTKRYALPAKFVAEGQVVASRELRELLAREVEEVDDRDAAALLRALVAFEWSRGIPYAEIKARFSAAIRSDETRRNERPVELSLHYSDIEQLCEQVAGVIRGAAEISFSDHHDWSTRMILLALQTEVGLPAWLAPIVKLRIDELHRNRLARLWEAQPVTEGWATVLDLPGIVDHPGISEQSRQNARDRLERREREESEFRHRVAQQLAGVYVPGTGGMSFEEFGEELHKSSSHDEYVDLWEEIAGGLGIAFERRKLAEHTEMLWSAGAVDVLLKIPHNEVGQEEVQMFAPDEGLVILNSRLRPSAYSELAGKPTVARFVPPEFVLTLVARLVDARGDALEAEEVLERLAEQRVSVIDAESVNVSLDVAGSHPPWPGPMPQIPPDPSRLTEMPEDEAD
ncbi:DEAD/DEAH box helicase [Micromonospora rosaria]|uniref:DEAD/DEAH box helicase n=1 Tax=Micromonospora rosaria TaxID=47874 RepID=UPI00147091F7|nr:DEAD/DEAH box helicase [Micromonospora rosaria]